jgi:hypothetical protein
MSPFVTCKKTPPSKEILYSDTRPPMAMESKVPKKNEIHFKSGTRGTLAKVLYLYDKE